MNWIYALFHSKKALILLTVVGFCFVLSGCGAVDPNDIAMFVAIKKANCWPCTAYQVVWDAIGKSVQELFPGISKLALNGLGVGLLFWLAFTIGKFIATVKEPNIKEFTTTMSTVLFKAMVVSVILATPANTLAIVDLIVTPIITSFTDLSRAVLFAEPTIAKHFAAPTFWDNVTSSVITGDVTGLFGGSNPSYSGITKDYPIFTSYLGNQVQDIIYRIYIAFNSGIALGARMAFTVDFISFITGVMIMLVFFYMMILFPLLFLEAFFMLGGIIILFPFLLAAWVFPSTKGYMKAVWDILFAATAQILITCIYVGVLVTVIKSYSSSFSLSKQLTDPALLLGLKNMSSNGLAFFALIYCMFKLSNDIPNITSFFVGEVNRSKMLAMFQKVQSLAASAGKFVAGAALTGAGAGAIGKGLMASAAKDTAKSVSQFGTAEDGSSTNDQTKNMQQDMMRQQQQQANQK